MKLNKKILAINLLASMVLSNAAFAGRIQGVRTPGAGPAGGGSSSERDNLPIKISEGEKVSTQQIEAVKVENCSDLNMDNEKYFPQELFKELTRDGDSLKVEMRENNTIYVKVPPIVKACGEFIPVLKQDTKTRNASVFIKLVKDGKEQTHGELEACLKTTKTASGKDLLKDGKVNHDELSGADYTQGLHKMIYDFDKKADIKKTASITFAYPVVYADPKNGYRPLYGFDEGQGDANAACTRRELIGDKPVYINKGREALLKEINEACKGSAQEIAEARKSLGNAEALKDISEKIKSEMDAAYIIAVQKDVEAIYSSMNDIENKIIKDGDTMDEAKAKKIIGEYVAEVKKLDTSFLDPALYRLDQLMKKREKMKEGSPAMKALDEEVKKLNLEIAKFSLRSNGLNNVYPLMQKFALNDSAKVIQDVFLKSQLYSHVYAGDKDARDEQVTFEKATEDHARRLKDFDKTLVEWSDESLAAKGSLAPIKKTEKEREAAIKRMYTRVNAYNKQEQVTYSKYCTGIMGASNPSKCKEFMAGKARRDALENRKTAKDDAYIKSKESKLTKLGTGYNAYQSKKQQAEEARAERYDPSGASISSYDDTFEERFPGYYGTTPTSYDSSQYSMGQQQQFQQGQFQQGGQTMQRYPAQQNGFQIAQPGGAGWPTLP